MEAFCCLQMLLDGGLSGRDEGRAERNRPSATLRGNLDLMVSQVVHCHFIPAAETVPVVFPAAC
jgi:hypothetical protein